MGDVASSLVSASTEELLRQAAAQEVKTLTNEYRLALAQALFLSVLEEKEAGKEVEVSWKLKRRTWKSFNRALHESWCWIKVPALGKKWKKLYCVARPDYSFEAYETKEHYSSAAKPKYSLRPSGYCILHAAEQWRQLWTKRTAYLLQTDTPKEISEKMREKPSPADYTICLSHPIMEPLFIGVETPAEKEVWNLILGDFIRRTSELKAVDELQKHALGAAVERTRKLHQWRDPDLVAAGNEIDVVYHVVAERLLGELGILARENQKLKFEKFTEKQRAIEAGFELVKAIAKDVVMNGTGDASYQKSKSDVEVEVRSLRPLVVKELKRLVNHKLNKQHENGNISEAFGAMGVALGTLSPSIDLGLNAVQSLFQDAVKELRGMIQRKPVYVNHVDIWFLRSMDPLSRDPLKLRPLLKSLVRLPRPAAASAYIHCQELLDSLVWTFENLISEGSMRNNGRLTPEEVTIIEGKVLEKLDTDKEELKRMLLAKWLLNEGRQRLPQVESLAPPGMPRTPRPNRKVEIENNVNPEEGFKEHDRRDIFMRPQLIQERVLLNKLRKHADELVAPKPIVEEDSSKLSAFSSIEDDQAEKLNYVKSEPPSPIPEVKRQDSISFLKEVVEGTKGLTIDFESNFTSSFSPKPAEKSSGLEPKPASEVTVTRSHTVNETWKSPMQRPKPRQPVLSPTLTTNLESLNNFNQNNHSTMSISSSEKSSAPSNTLNPAQLQQIRALTGIRPKEIKPKKKSTSSSSEIKSSSASKVLENGTNKGPSKKVDVNYRDVDNRLKPIDPADPVILPGTTQISNEITEKLLNKPEGNTEGKKPVVITAKVTSPHVQALNERYATQEAELQKADREREKKDLLEKGNSSAPSDSSMKSASFGGGLMSGITSRGAKRQPSPKPRTEEWVQQHMNQQPEAPEEQSDEQKLNDDYEKRKHLYENLPRSSPTPQGLSSSQPHLNLLGGRDNDLRSKSAAQATIISEMKLGSEPDIQHRSVESIPTKTATRKKRAKDTRARDIPDDSTDDNLPREAAEMTVKSKSAILNESAIAGTVKRKKKKKKIDVLSANVEEPPIDVNNNTKTDAKENQKQTASKPERKEENPSSKSSAVPATKPIAEKKKSSNSSSSSKPRKSTTRNDAKTTPDPAKTASSSSDTKIKGYRDFNELQREMRERQKELKKKLKQQKKAEKAKKKEEEAEGRISDNSNDSDLPEKYIEENITERQFVDQNGKVQKEIIKTEVLKTRSRSRSKSRSKISADGITHTEHIDLTTGHQDSVIKRTLKEKIREKEKRGREKSSF